MDCNEDVRCAAFNNWLQTHSLTDSVITAHGGGNAPPTYNRGSKPIDGVFCSNTLHITACGYLPFGAFPSDHRAIWADITYDSAFGFKISRCVQPKARKLQCIDPRVVKKWAQAYEQFIKQHNLHCRQFALEQHMTTPLTDWWAQEYEDILTLRVEKNEGVHIFWRNRSTF